MQRRRRRLRPCRCKHRGRLHHKTEISGAHTCYTSPQHRPEPRSGTRHHAVLPHPACGGSPRPPRAQAVRVPVGGRPWLRLGSCPGSVVLSGSKRRGSCAPGSPGCSSAAGAVPGTVGPRVPTGSNVAPVGPRCQGCDGARRARPPTAAATPPRPAPAGPAAGPPGRHLQQHRAHGPCDLRRRLRRLQHLQPDVLRVGQLSAPAARKASSTGCTRPVPLPQPRPAPPPPRRVTSRRTRPAWCGARSRRPALAQRRRRAAPATCRLPAAPRAATPPPASAAARPLRAASGGQLDPCITSWHQTGTGRHLAECPC